MRRISSTRRVGRAFTLIELLVVVAIIGLLISILLPSLRRARESAKTAVCASNLHQMVVTTKYYAADNGDHIPLIPGSYSTGYCNAPYAQYYQLYRLYPYLKGELNIYRCPSAKEQNSVMSLFGKNDTATIPSTDPTVINEGSLYFVRKSDEFYPVVAYPKKYWPQFDPFDLAGDEFPELRTEYFLNDYNPSTCKSPIKDPRGRPVANLNGGTIETIPGPQFAVVYADWSAYAEPELQRHNHKSQLAFVDGHVNLFDKPRYFDTDKKTPSAKKLDYDGFGNRPFYTWGMTKNGRDWN